MKQFANIAAFVAHLRMVAAAIPEAEHRGLEAAAKIIRDEARAEIGRYQSEAGPFEAWQELADRTKADRVASGFSENDPLLRSGELLNSIEYTVSGREAVVGSNLDIAVWQEMGTPNAAHPIPPRSFLGGAAFRKGAEAAKAAGEAVAQAAAGKRL